jgi:hypothetical protein
MHSCFLSIFETLKTKRLDQQILRRHDTQYNDDIYNNDNWYNAPLPHSA